jgi:hypothetical protein
MYVTTSPQGDGRFADLHQSYLTNHEHSSIQAYARELQSSVLRCKNLKLMQQGLPKLPTGRARQTFQTIRDNGWWPLPFSITPRLAKQDLSLGSSGCRQVLVYLATPQAFCARLPNSACLVISTVSPARGTPNYNPIADALTLTCQFSL